MRAIVVQEATRNIPTSVSGALAHAHWELSTASGYTEALSQTRLGDVDAIFMTGSQHTSQDSSGSMARNQLLRLADSKQIATLIIVDPADTSQTDSEGDFVEFITSDISADELQGRFAMIQRYNKHLRQVEQELRSMERMSKRIDDHFRELDQEMRLASRLQRDFLPESQHTIGNLRFASTYRPASWVSGDIFDIFRVDEHHTAFYVADAVGHGVAASLLTMFVKRSIVTKEVNGSDYRVLDPGQTMSILNDALADQSLPNCQFVTACCGIIDHRTMALQIARGGHPYPLLISPDGLITEIKSTGGLLGIMNDQEFPMVETHLHPGDKLLIYTDGMELAFQGDGSEALDTTAFQRVFETSACRHIDDLVHHVETLLDDDKGSLNPSDDVTIVGLEVLSDQPAPLES